MHFQQIARRQRMPLAGKTSTLQPAAISLSPVFQPVTMHSGPFIRQTGEICIRPQQISWIILSFAKEGSERSA
jgi:hypothetical protein